MGTFFGFRAMWGGGVCARLTRESRISAAVERSLEAGVPAVLYAHPWEFDDAHPAMPGLSPVQRLVHFAGRRRTEARWARWLERWTFAPVSSAMEEKKEDFASEGERGTEEEEKISETGKRERAGEAA
jgi:hypothetical protein